MKSIIFCLLIVSLSAYSTDKAIKYARKYCKNYNPDYKKYNGADCANFVSQCLIAGGQSLKGCNGLDAKGAIPYVPNLQSCLTKKGWKSQKGVPKQFKGGYPFFIPNQHAIIATGVSGKTVTFCGHTNDRCDSTVNNQNYVYYYL